MFGYELSRKLAGTGVTANVMCPGIIHSHCSNDEGHNWHWTAIKGFIPQTNLNREAPWALRMIMRYVFPLFSFTRSVDHGADCIVKLALDESLKDVTGAFPSSFLLFLVALFLNNNGVVATAATIQESGSRIWRNKNRVPSLTTRTRRSSSGTCARTWPLLTRRTSPGSNHNSTTCLSEKYWGWELSFIRTQRRHIPDMIWRVQSEEIRKFSEK